MTKVLEYYCVTHMGKMRDNHEDNYLTCDGKLITLKQQKRMTVKHPQIITRKVIKGDKAFPAVFSIADGMGGYKAGEIASNTVVTELKKKLKAGHKFANTLKSPVETVVKYINDINFLVNIKAGADDKLSGMGSTIATLVFEQDGVTAINVGDSRAYLFENGMLKQISHDHTFGQQICDMGLEKDVNLEMVSYRKSLTRYVGMESSLTEDITKISDKVPYESSQVYLICSDGLTDEVSPEEIEKICSDYNGELTGIGEVLLKFALGNNGKEIGGRDNITFMLIKCRDEK